MTVLGLSMWFVDEGGAQAGPVGHRLAPRLETRTSTHRGRRLPAILFLHGNAVHSYYWRNVIPFLAHHTQCLAPDLMGMGRSDVVVPSGAASYTLEEQLTYLDALMELLNPGPVLIVAQELGALLGAAWAHHHPGDVRGMVLLDPALLPADPGGWDPGLRDFVAAARDEDGEELVLRSNGVIDQYLPALTMRRLSPPEMESYRRPHSLVGEARRPLLTFLRSLPILGMPGLSDEAAAAAAKWLADTSFPKLVIAGDPGHLVGASQTEEMELWRETTLASVRGRHFLLEDSPVRVNTLVLDWLEDIEEQAPAR